MKKDKRTILQELLFKKTLGCGIQHDGWPCNTCFHALPLSVSPDRLHELWVATLQFRGDYKKEDLGSNVSDDSTLMKNIDELIGLLLEI